MKLDIIAVVGSSAIALLGVHDSSLAPQSGVDVLQDVIEHSADPEPFFTSFAAFEGPLLVRRPTETLVPVTPASFSSVLLNRDGAVPPDTIFDLAPGVYEAPTAITFRDAHFVTIRGAGMDRTTIRAPRGLLVCQGAENLRLENFTVAGDNAVLYARNRSSARLENVRLKGFGDGLPVTACAIGAYGESYIACVRCEFIGGFCASPRGGSAVSLTARGFIYLKDCFLPELRSFIYAVDEGTGRSIIRADGCRLPYNDSTGCYAAGISVRLKDCAFNPVARTSLARGETKDCGGNEIHVVLEKELPTLLEVVRRTEDLGLRIVYAKRSQGLVQNDATYTEIHDVTQDGDIHQRTWFTPIHGSPEIRYVTKVEPHADPKTPRFRDDVKIKASDAVVNAISVLGPKISAIWLEPGTENSPVYVISADCGGQSQVRVDARTAKEIH
jgi:hypothetical protein